MRDLSSIRAALLDMDGTLVDSDAAVDRAWRQWCRLTGVPFARVEQVAPGQQAITTIAQLLTSWSEDECARGAQLQLDLQYTDLDDVTAAFGADVLLETLRALDLPWAVVTSADRRLAGERLWVAGITAPLVVTSQDTDRGKPHPDGYLLAAEKLGIAPERCLVVEDATAGITAATAAGMRVAGLRGVGGDIPIDDLAQLARLLTTVTS